MIRGFWLQLQHVKALEVFTLIFTIRKKKNLKLLSFYGPSREFSLQGKLLPNIRRVGHVQRVTAKICLLEAEASRVINK